MDVYLGDSGHGAAYHVFLAVFEELHDYDTHVLAVGLGDAAAALVNEYDLDEGDVNDAMEDAANEFGRSLDEIFAAEP